MFFVARLCGSAVLGAVHNNRDAIADALVLLALPGVLLSLLDLFGREGNTPHCAGGRALASLSSWQSACC